MSRRSPITIDLPPSGIYVTESVHAPSFRMRSQTDRFHEIFHVVRGHVRLETGGSDREEPGGRSILGTGAYGVVPAGTPHRLEDAAGSALLLLCLSPDFVQSRAERLAVWNHLVGRSGAIPAPNSAHHSEELRKLWRRMLALQNRHASARTTLEMASWVDQLLLALVDLAGQEGPGDSTERMQRFVAELPERLYESWTVDRAARQTGLSVRRFAQLFKQETGTSFVPHLSELRIRRVCELLASGRHSPIVAAFSCGFEDLAHFYRVFKRYRGCTPGRYVERMSR